VDVVPLANQIVAAADYNVIFAIGNANVTAIMNYLMSQPGKDAMKWAINNADLLWNMSEHLMRTRGHHYKQEYDTMIERMYKSSSTGNVDWPVTVSKNDVLRTAIHPFGIKALPHIALRNIWHGTIGNGMIRRITGASNGYAAATTAYAAFAMISSEPWYGAYSAAYADQIELVSVFARTMLDDRYAFHESANLYGIVPKRTIYWNDTNYSMQDVDSAVSAVAPVLQGFIEWSKEQSRTTASTTFAFANAKVLEKRTQSNPIAVIRLKSLLQATIENIKDAESTKASIREAFPMIKEGEDEEEE